MTGAGGMLLVTRTDSNRFDARFACPAMFVPCMGARDEETAQKLSVAFKRGTSETCGCHGAIHNLTKPVGAQATAAF
jgi:protein-L-isoaspartate(D-aspartate) O-methyltransferase